MEDIEYAYTRGLDDEAVATRLGDTGHGVLALSRDGEAYAIPVAYAFDGERFLFRLGLDSDSRKRGFLEATETATLVVYEVTPTDEAEAVSTWSVIARGPIERLEGADHDAYPTETINELFAPIRVFDEPIDEMTVQVYELAPESLTGRATE